MVLGLVFSVGVEVGQAQQADCSLTGNAKLPSKVTFDDGSTVTVLDRAGDKLRTETIPADGREFRQNAYRGLFELTHELSTTIIEYRWNQDLASFFPLRVGQNMVADGAVVLLDNNATAKLGIEKAVIAEEMVRIGGCDYPVFKIETSLRFELGPTPGKATHYYHAPSMLTLKSIVPAIKPSAMVERHAIRIE